MPRRRPPGTGPGPGRTLKSTTALLTLLLVLPWLATAAQQQQPPPAHGQARPKRSVGSAINSDINGDINSNSNSNTNPNPNSNTKPNSNSNPTTNTNRNINTYTPLISQNARAVATKLSSAPADPPAVRAPLARNAAQSARSLRDWEVEDFVLLATVDGRIHARDRYNGNDIWVLDVGQPMLETIYENSTDSTDPQNPPFVWIVEPKEDGPLYILTPGVHPVLSSLGMTVKQLAEDLAPYVATEPPVVYLADKKNVMLVVDARTGDVVKSFSTNGTKFLNTESCVPQQASEYFEAGGQAKERECKGLFNIGRTEYTISIQNQVTGKNICTIKYSEWSPNNRDRDLQAQYQEAMDGQYIYARYNGVAIAMDHKRPKPAARPVYTQRFSSPVVRIFDVARPNNDEDPEASLVLLPQPPGPPGSFVPEKEKFVWLNTTEQGSWYALSEVNYPAVTDKAPPALCYSADWSNNHLLNLDIPHLLPDRNSLVGVHILDHHGQARPFVAGIDAPPPSGPYLELPASPYQKEDDDENIITPHTQSKILYTLIALAIVAVLMFRIGGPAQLASFKKRLLSRFGKIATKKPSKVEAPSTSPTEPQVLQEAGVEVPHVDSKSPEASDKNLALDTGVDVEHEKKVRFEIPDDAEDLEPLSRITTAEYLDNDLEESARELSQLGLNGNAADPSTPAKKKKTHRGRRGGVKKKTKSLENLEGDEVDRIVNAAKELDQSPSIHPDEITEPGYDIQDVSNIKKIGKLTIDFDRLLGNGSGGTFVFEGKWNEREVAVKRMLPQYFGLAEQEVKLLQESDLHPNVIRYFDDEKDENFLYIAVELCQASLFDLYRDGRPGDELTETQQRLVNEINLDVPRALYQLALGVNHLHNLRIIHRDIKPQNILIAYPQRSQKNGPRLVISDFGLCKTLPDNVSTLIGTTGNAGTVGWKAPELILQPRETDRGSSTGHSRDSSSSSDQVAQGVKRAVDIFSLGCVFYYVMTNGSHPYDDEEGWMQMRELNIKKNKSNLKQLNLGDDSEEPLHLIEWMLENRPEARPTAVEVMNHPFFWSAEKRLNFLCDCSDHWERESRDPPSEHLSMLEDYARDVIADSSESKRPPDFLSKLNRAFVASLGKQRKYTGDRLLDLLRALRNKKNHYEDMDESVKAMVGPLPEGYLRYWTVRFPRLVISCYRVVKGCGLEGEPRFRPYFEGRAGI